MRGAQPTQLSLLSVTFGLQVSDDFNICGTLCALQFGLAAQGRQFGLLLGLDAAHLGELDSASFQLDREPLMGQRCLPEPFIEHGLLGLTGGQTALQINAQRSQCQHAERQADQ